ncbi:MAG: ABC transporter ATP-binding protein [Clostridium tyrobutyricum]|jgi:putative ABC transport system ATP-binding protein|uniref:ABC transporter ATP-binding protein n=1 Tax=Clostridium tyrobutyricum TaxID=1519 RepID=UPI00057FD38E|nr:ABC transporter ATP-binding protein [Clostridium tyrobutyricum]MBV4421731.1 ABC transporter ATP-binding protein [Clostridium tyrobutyricum]MBV4437628.1 ABC transporter ATP-binding protein [Clostridium tyrobutyricum]MBV4446129.1 ABC transporter ATP-binding protein [Clostridium tyrobutyricum]MCH4199827.1 ABC transporter ATP-binding protein [Clostridium tyrobutyricum]MCH4237659.1 ABC transporter ATP-binding protein [Clostridium tyrobutyricum]
MEIIKLKNINKVYNSKNNQVNALKDINLTIDKGELIAIVGPSGSGKSTLLNIIGTLDKITNGEYLLRDEQVEKLNNYQLSRLRNKTFGFVVQHFALISDYTVSENIEIPLEYGKVKHSERKVLINKVVDKLSLTDKINKNIKELSGGQCQRVAIARAIVNDPEIILADEPTGALDQKTGQNVMNIFKSLNKEGKTVIIVTHDSKIAGQCDRIIKIEDGRILH